MAKSPKSKPAGDPEDGPVPLTEPDSGPQTAEADDYERGENPWLRGLWMLLFAVLFYIAQWVLMVATLLQFLWILFAKERNAHIADLGDSLSKWLARVARFQTAASEAKPFPFARLDE